ncbi:MAG: prephenate dehydratase [Bifidobacteriaceae bacterium]|jgi:prephenate dehydratase|nr:prephenate dehydratase [Bifidobacteriaceae bacterium]
MPPIEPNQPAPTRAPGRSRFAYLGPAGTFTETALRQVVSPDEVDYLPQIDVVSAMEAVRSGDADYAVVAIENSVEGGVTAVLDTLATGEPLVILREMLVPVSFTLAALGPARLQDVRRVAAHPHAWAQCRRWFNQNLRGAVHVPASSNTAPAQELARLAADPLAPAPAFDAALVPPAALAQYGLTALAAGVADNAAAVTRFVLIGHPGQTPEPTGADKTTMVVHLPAERSGALLELLEQFATRGVNLTRIESRPSGVALGRYSFSIDAEGHVADARMSEAMVGLHRFAPLVRYLGSYPRADGAPIQVMEGTLDKDFRAAHDWVAAVRAGTQV